MLNLKDLLPELTLPQFAFADVISLLGAAFTIAMLGAIESLLSAVVADGMTGHQHNSNQELFGQGLANIEGVELAGQQAYARNIRRRRPARVQQLRESRRTVELVASASRFSKHTRGTSPLAEATGSRRCCEGERSAAVAHSSGGPPPRRRRQPRAPRGVCVRRY